MSEDHRADGAGATVIARSPIEAGEPCVRFGWEVSARRSTAGLTLCDKTPMAKILVRAPFDGATRHALGVSFGRAARTDTAAIGDVLIVGSAPGEWLALGAPGTGPALREHLETTAATSDEFTSVVDLTHGRALMRIRGRAAPEMLSKICSIDLHESVTPNGAAFRTSVATLVTDVVRDDDGGEPSFLLHCERSSGQYLFDALLDAGAEHHIDSTGLEPTGN